jgi:tRNA (cmo5U34)-methyltransferase
VTTTLAIPPSWTFEDAGVAEHFDSHVREQLPWYGLATTAVAHLARHYIADDGLVYDIGCSTGNIGRALADALDERRARLIAIEKSPEMASRYAGPAGTLVIDDCTQVQFEPFDVAVLFLTMMFIPARARLALLDLLRQRCRPGGAIILVDKLEATGGYIATALWRLTLAAKLDQGAAPADVLAKELSLIGVQRPISTALVAGWQPFFRYGDFAGFIWEAPQVPTGGVARRDGEGFDVA